MEGRTWCVVAVSLVTGLTMLPGMGQAAGDEDESAWTAIFEDGLARPNQLFRVEWIASQGRSGRPRLEGSVLNNYGRTALNVQLRISEIDAAGETVSTVIGPTLEAVPGQSQVNFEVQVPDNRHSYRVAVASFSFDFAEPASR